MQPAEKLRSGLARYHALRQHNDPAFRARLHRIQAWQARRLQHTHAAIIADPRLHDAAELFLSDIYGGIDLMPMATEIERALPLAVRLLPDSVLHTSAMAVEIMVLIQTVDEALTDLYFRQYGSSDNQRMDDYIAAVRALGRFDERRQVLALVRQLGDGLDKYVRSRVIQATFRIANKPAHKYGLGALYDFLDRGFRVMRPLGSTHELFDAMAHDEEAVLDRLESGAADPFGLQGIEP